MAIHYIPPAYPRREPKEMSALGYWAQNMMPMMQMMMQKNMQQKQWKERTEIQQKAKAKEQDKADYSRLREQGWQTAEEIGYGKEYTPTPTVVKQGMGLYRPSISRVDLPGGGFATMYGSKLLKVSEPKDPKFTYGAAYTSKGRRIVPVFQEGKVFERIDLGEISVDEKLSEQQKSDIMEERQKAIAKFKGGLDKKPTSQIEQYKLSVKQGYKGSFIEWKKEIAKAGAPTMTQQMGLERFGLQKEQTAGNIRLELIQGKEDIYRARAPMFNKLNKTNEVAYWETKGLDKTKFLKLPKRAIENGWTPEKVQEFANQGATVKQILENSGIMEGIIILSPEAFAQGWTIERIREEAKRENKSVGQFIRDWGLK